MPREDWIPDPPDAVPPSGWIRVKTPDGKYYWADYPRDEKRFFIEGPRNIEVNYEDPELFNRKYALNLAWWRTLDSVRSKTILVLIRHQHQDDAPTGLGCNCGLHDLQPGVHWFRVDADGEWYHVTEEQVVNFVNKAVAKAVSGEEP